MLQKIVLRVLLVTMVFATAGVAYILACQGTPRPNCGQSIFLAKFPRRTVVFPGAGIGFTVPIGLLPFVTWNPNILCAQPSAASLELTLTCAPMGGGAPVVIGPVAVPVAVPTIPGPQPIAGGAFPFPIPGGAIAAAGAICIVSGTYSVTFAGGVGAGTITGVGDTTICIVEPSPSDTTIPRLNLEHLTAGMGEFQVCRRGDQAFTFYLLENNDPDNYAFVTLTGTTKQSARTPASGDPSVIFALSSPNAGEDNFPHQFGDEFPTGLLLPPGDPHIVSDHDITTNIALPPFGVAVIPTIIRSYEMCADGSCSEQLITASGFFGDGDPILGCAGTALLAGPMPGKSPLCETTDAVSTGGSTKVTWSTGIFTFKEKSALPQMTHGAGNLLINEGGPGTQTGGPGSGLQMFPQQAADYFRSSINPTNVQYVANGTTQLSPGNPQINNVNIKNLPPTGSISFPLIVNPNGPGNFLINKDAKSAKVSITDQNTNKKVFNGSFFDLGTFQSEFFVVDPSANRIFNKSPKPAQRWLQSQPPCFGTTSTSDLFGTFSTSFDPQGFINNFPSDVSWGASIDSNAINLVNPTGGPGDFIDITFNGGNIAVAPETTIVHITVTSADAFNDPVVIPIALRRFEAPPTFMGFDITSLSIKLNHDPHKALKDSLTLKGTLDVPEGFNPEGQTVIINIGGLGLVYTLDANGVATPVNKNNSFKFTFKKVNGVIQAGPAPFTVTIKNKPLSGYFRDDGMLNESIAKPGLEIDIPVAVQFQAVSKLATETVIYTSTTDKTASAKTKKN
ncbi:MAG: hypothetical protein ACKVS6_01955 [Planctomycetota bacterium]